MNKQYLKYLKSVLRKIQKLPINKVVKSKKKYSRKNKHKVNIEI